MRVGRYILALLLALPGLSWGETESEAVNMAPSIVSKIKIDQKLGQKIPFDIPFVDESGAKVEIGSYFGKNPVVLALVYFECPSLCTMVLNGLFRSLQEVKLDRGKEFSVVVVSIDPKETPTLAAAKKAKYTKTYLHSGSESGLHFLTGEQASITRLAQAVGFGYEYDPKLKIYAHPGTIMITTPDGVLSRYLFGVDYPEREVRLSLVEASGNQIGDVTDHFLLYCYKFDPLAGKYGLVVMNMLRVAGIVTLLLIGGLVGWLIRVDGKFTT